MRYQVILSQSGDLTKVNNEKLAQQFSNVTKNKYSDEKLYIDEINENNLLSYQVKQDSERQSVHNI